MKPEIEETVHSVFVDTDINITFKGHRYLGSPIGSNFIQDKISKWVNQLEKRIIVAQTQPHASYSALTYRFFNKIVYLCRTTPGVHEHTHPLEDCLRMKLRSAILCLQGARSSYHKLIFSNLNSLDRALSEGRVAH